ncbi:MAG: BNR-4 repeat-containing protein [Acidimicrobiales bacterium]
MMEPPHPPAERTWLRVMVVVALVGALVGAAVWWDPRGEDARDVDTRNGRAFIQDNLWSTATDRLAIWVGDGGQPVLGVRSDSGPWTTTDLGEIEGNPLDSPTEDDNHNVYAVAGDPLGHIHVMGNMHGDRLRYIRTAEPGRTDRWIEPPMGGANQSVTYPALVGLPDGTVLFFRREGTVGLAQTLLDRLAPGSEDWEHIGPVIDGRPSDESAYLQHVAVDPDTGTVHVGFLWRQGRGTIRNNDVSYMRSDDGGTSWTTSAGAPLTLPVLHDSAEVVVDTPRRDADLLNNGGMVVAADGNPHMVFAGRAEVLHVWFDGTTWHTDTPIPAFRANRPAAARGADGSVWAIGVRGTRITALQVYPDVGGEVVAGTAPRGWEATYDTQAHQQSDRVEILVVGADDEPVIETLDLPGG